MILWLTSIESHAQDTKLRWSKYLTDTAITMNPMRKYYDHSPFACDEQGNVYLTVCKFLPGDSSIPILKKISSEGELLWEKPILSWQYNQLLFTNYSIYTDLYIDVDKNLVCITALSDTINNTPIMLMQKKWDYAGYELQQKIDSIGGGWIEEVSHNEEGNIGIIMGGNSGPGTDTFTLIITDKNFNTIMKKNHMVFIDNFKLRPVILLRDTMLYIMVVNTNFDQAVINSYSLVSGNNLWSTTFPFSRQFYHDHLYAVGNALYAFGSGITKFSLDGAIIDSFHFSGIDSAINFVQYDSVNAHFFCTELNLVNAGKGYRIYIFDTSCHLISTLCPSVAPIGRNYALGVDKYDSVIYLWGVGSVASGTYERINNVYFTRIHRNGYVLDNATWKPDLVTQRHFQSEVHSDKNGNLIYVTQVINSFSPLHTYTLECDPIFIGKHSFDSSANIRGRAYIDHSATCYQDALSVSLENQVVRLMPAGIYTITDSNGMYRFEKKNGSGTIELIPSMANGNYCVNNNVISFQVSNGALIDTLNFGIQVDNPMPNGRIDIFSSQARPGFPHFISATAENISFKKIEHSWISIKVDSMFQYINATPLPDSVSGNTFFWKWDSINPGSKYYINIETQCMAGVNQLGLPFSHTCFFDVVDDYDTPNNYDIRNGIITGAFDPNIKSVEPIGLDEQHYIPETTRLEYYVEFQNTGTDTAFNIMINDELDADLDITTLKFMGSSHPCSYSLLDRTLQFHFKNILLPDSNKNYKKSIGYLVYSIKPRPSPKGTKITNTASIFFDFNPPIVTNTTMNTIGVPQYLDSYKIYPNPTSNGQISIALHLIRANNVRMSLNDVTGRECRILYNSKMETGDHTIKCQLPNAIPGMLYFLKVQIGNHVSVEKLLITD